MTILTHRCQGSQALAEFAKKRAEAKARGLSVVMVGGPDDWSRLEENAELNPPDVTALIRDVPSLSVPAWFAEKKQGYFESLDDEADVVGEWEGPGDHGSPSLHLDILTRKPKTEVIIATVPVPQSWQVPAAFGYGGWNACPDPLEQCAVARYWAERYDADIVGMSGDVIEWEVRRPPTTPEAAMELAWEQFLFCDDIVHQGMGTIGALAGTLIKSPYWYFWWD